MPSPFENSQAYNQPDGGAASDIGSQINLHKYRRKALIELQKQKFFSQLADTYTMPKHRGKKIRQYQWVPLLDDANINNQGIDAAGVTTTREVTIVISAPGATQGLYSSTYASGEGPDDAAALAAAKVEAVRFFTSVGVFDTDYATTKANLEALADPWTIDDTGASVPASGNLYGSSRDVGYISTRMPALGEHGGRVNRVGFTRLEIQGTFAKFGFFDEYTKDLLNLDTESELLMHIDREMLRGAHQITEDAIQIDLLNSPGIVVYCGSATSTSEINGNVGTESVVSYRDFSNLNIDLDNNNTPKQTKIIVGSRMTDTRVLTSQRVMYMGTELIPTLETITDTFGKPVFIRAVHYAEAGTLLNGEYGAIGDFRIVVNPEMMRWEGAGADVTNNAGFYETNGKYDVFPMLTVGDASFTTIGFETSGVGKYKFQIIHKKPSKATADRNDPYGQTGFMSILWWYGFLAQRPERIGLIKTVARY